MPSFARLGDVRELRRGSFDSDGVAVLQRRAGRSRGDVDERLAEQAHRSDRRARLGRDARLVLLR